MELKQLADTIEKIGSAFDEYKKVNDERAAKAAKGEAVADLEAKLDKISADMDSLAEIKASLEKVETRLARPGAFGSQSDAGQAEFKSFAELPVRKGGVVDAAGYDSYKSALNAFLRCKGDDRMLKPDELRAMQAGIDSDGGYLLPMPAVASIVTKVREQNIMRSLAGSITISTNAIEGLVDRNDAAAAWVGEVTARPETNTPQVDKDRIETFEIYSFPFVSQQLLEDAAVNVEAWLVDKVSTAFAEAEDAAFITGNGVTRPRGFTTYTTAATADASRAWGTMQHVNTGANGAFHTTKADPLFDLIAAFKPGYLNGATWLMSRAALAAVRKLKEATTDQYLWQPGLQAGVPSTLLGYPAALDEGMPAHTTTGGLGIALGNFQRGYLIVDRVGISVLRDPYTSKPRVGLYVRKRVGGAVRDYDAIKFLRFAS